MVAVTVATWNAGRGREADLLNLLGISDLIGLTGQEWGDREDLTDEARGEGCTVLTGGGVPGLASTPLLVPPRVHIGRELAQVIVPSRHVGPGAGPSRSKAKGAVGARLRVTPGTAVGVASTHLVASSYLPLRRRAAADHIAGLVALFDQRQIPWLVCGDFNTTPDSRLLRPLYEAGWTNTHREGGVRATHGRRAIDYVWWKRSPRVEFLGHETLSTHSDHQALIAHFKIKETHR